MKLPPEVFVKCSLIATRFFDMDDPKFVGTIKQLAVTYGYVQCDEKDPGSFVHSPELERLSSPMRLCLCALADINPEELVDIKKKDVNDDQQK